MTTPSNETADSRNPDSDGAEPSFGEAMEQIETILDSIEGDEIDIDQLASRLDQAAGLLELCRAKIRRAESEVEEVSKRFDASDD